MSKLVFSLCRIRLWVSIMFGFNVKRVRFCFLLGLSLWMCLSCFSVGTWAQISTPTLDPSCTATVLNRLTQVSEDGSFLVQNVPVPQGQFRVRFVCDRDTGTELAQSAFLSGVANDFTPISNYQSETLLSIGGASDHG